MKRFAGLWAIPLLLFLTTPGQGASTLDEIIKGVEHRYAETGFSARFIQTSTIKAMDITEIAYGRLFAKHPGMMRWEYESPDRQLVVTDGTRLWVYRHHDKQVMIGKAPSFFGDGKGAGFLSDIQRIRDNFEIALGEVSGGSVYRLILFPKHKTYDIAMVHLAVSARTFDVVEVTTVNPYDDTTRIELKDILHETTLADSLFRFEIPPGADVIKIDE